MENVSPHPYSGVRMRVRKCGGELLRERPARARARVQDAATRAREATAQSMCMRASMRALNSSCIAFTIVFRTPAWEHKRTHMCERIFSECGRGRCEERGTVSKGACTFSSPCARDLLST